MKISALYMEDARHRARDQLSPTFARDVIQVAAQRRLARTQLRIVALTAGVCIVTAISTQLLRTHFADQRNLEAWNNTTTQVRVLEETI